MAAHRAIPVRAVLRLALLLLAARTARCDSQEDPEAVAATLVNPMEKPALDRIARQYEIDIEERIIPSGEDVADVVAERLTALLEARLRTRDKLQTERSQRFTALARELAEQEEELPIITMLLDDYYQKMLHPTVERLKSEKKSSQRGRSKKRSSKRRRDGQRKQR